MLTAFHNLQFRYKLEIHEEFHDNDFINYLKYL